MEDAERLAIDNKRLTGIILRMQTEIDELKNRLEYKDGIIAGKDERIKELTN